MDANGSLTATRIMSFMLDVILFRSLSVSLLLTKWDGDMPIKAEKIKLAGTKYDARAKLSPDQRTAIKVLSEQGYSQRKLAAMFNVSKRLIQSIVAPTERKPEKKRPTEYWTQVKRKYRERKMSLYKAGKIKFGKKDKL